jgi:hypothetical protein
MEKIIVTISLIMTLFFTTLLCYGLISVGLWWQDNHISQRIETFADKNFPVGK